MQDVLQLYQRQLGPLSSQQRDVLYQAADEGMAPFVIGCAILRASQERRLSGGTKRISFNYVKAIIDDWLVHGIIDEERYREYHAHRSGGTSPANASNTDGDRRRKQGHGSADTPRKFARSDFHYEKPKPLPKGTFSFLDD